MKTLLRAAPDSRRILRFLMWTSAAVGVLFLPASPRSASRLAGEEHHKIALWVAMTPWLLIALACLMGTVSQFEDATFRRRFLFAAALTLPLPIAGVAIFYFAPEFRLFSRPGTLVWGVYWLSSWYGLLPFNGAGPWADTWLTRWLGPPAAAETAMRERERDIRQAATQEERNRLAQDLHDSIKQEIFAIHTSAATAEAHLSTDPDGTKKALEQIRTSSRDAMTEMEALLDRLNPTPLENTGLVAAIKKQCEALALRTGAVVDCHIGALPESSRLPPGAHEALFRIAQEALSNIGKHARADRVSVRLELAERDLLLTIRDNGQGFEQWGKEAPAPGMGIASMRARAAAVGGQLGIVASPRKGVVLRVGIIVLSKTNFGLGEMTTGQKWLLYSCAGLVLIPVAFSVYFMAFTAVEAWEFWAFIVVLFAPKMAIEAWRKRRSQKRITA